MKQFWQDNSHSLTNTLVSVGIVVVILVAMYQLAVLFMGNG
jgi:hypothetical protein